MYYFNMKTPEDRLFAKTALDEETGCLEWTGHISPSGYGYIRIDGKQVSTHRAAWSFQHGPIAEGLVVRHKCDNPKCCNISHLELGTLAENSGDMLERGRFVGKTGGVKLSHEKAESIRIMDRAGIAQSEIAKLFGVSRGSIRLVVQGKTWRT